MGIKGFEVVCKMKVLRLERKLSILQITALRARRDNSRIARFQLSS